MSEPRKRRLPQDRETWSRDLRWLCEITRPFLASILSLLLFDVLMALAGVGTTLINKRLIDGATGGGFSVANMIPMAALTLVSLAAGGGVSVLTISINERFSFGLRSRLFQRVLQSRWERIGRMHTGDVNTRLTADADAVTSGVISTLPTCCYMAFRLAMAFFVLYGFDRMLALATLLATPAGIIASLLLSKKLSRYQAELKKNEALARGFMQESVSNITLYKTFEREPAARARLREIWEARQPLVRGRCLWTVLSRFLMNLVFSGGYLFALGWGLYRLSLGEITYGTLSVFFSLVSQIQNPLAILSSLIPQLANIFASTDRLLEIDRLSPEEAEVPVELRGDVGLRLEGVCFRYENEDVLSSANLDVRPGEIVGVVGESGIGKTTLARLALALIRPQKGEVFFYDREGRAERASAASRRLISYVPQGNTLLSGTLRENLRMGRPDADEAEMRAALEISQAQFVFSLPQGLDTEISERAGTLSEGQAQRIAIARALLRETPVMILDEVTSALDLHTERRIIESLKAQTRNVTCLVITHRRSLLAMCDRCVSLCDGAIFDCDDLEDEA
ncbi:MAG: ABC transporter ATP-binding protein [Clostridia bacterium]|nr:ABC transporter ATP-binding protein [Clostridia bacterium]